MVDIGKQWISELFVRGERLVLGRRVE